MSKPCKQKSIQSGSGLLFKDKPFFTKTFKKAIGSEKKFMTAYASFARNSNRYFKILKEHIDNLEAVDKVMVNVLGEKGAFKEMFIRHVLGGDIRTGNIKINTKNPLLVKNYPLQSYTDVADLVESYLSSQVWFKLWEKFPQDEKLITEISCVRKARNKVEVTITTIHTEKHRKVFEGLRSAGIGVNLHYMPVHLQPYYKKLGFAAGQFPEAEAYGNEAITLPLFTDLSDVQQKRVVKVLSDLL